MIFNHKFKYKLGDIIKTVSGDIGTIMFYYYHIFEGITYYGYTIALETNLEKGHDGYPNAYTSLGKRVPPLIYKNLIWCMETNATLIKSRKDFLYKITI